MRFGKAKVQKNDVFLFVFALTFHYLCTALS